MPYSNVVIIVLVVLVTGFLAWRQRPLTVVLLGTASLLFSALLFLPGDVLRGVVGRELMGSMEAAARQVPWSLGVISHFVGFMMLAIMLWWLRPELRVWPCIGVLVALSVGSELVQMLTPTREARLDDVLVNLMGAAAGLALAMPVTLIRKWLRRPAGQGR